MGGKSTAVLWKRTENIDKISRAASVKGESRGQPEAGKKTRHKWEMLKNIQVEGQQIYREGKLEQIKSKGVQWFQRHLTTNQLSTRMEEDRNTVLWMRMENNEGTVSDTEQTRRFLHHGFNNWFPKFKQPMSEEQLCPRIKWRKEQRNTCWPADTLSFQTLPPASHPPLLSLYIQV